MLNKFYRISSTEINTYNSFQTVKIYVKNQVKCSLIKITLFSLVYYLRGAKYDC